MGGAGAAAAAALRRIPRIKFPQRHPPNSTSPPPSGSASQSRAASTKKETSQNVTKTSEVPAEPNNVAMGGKASLQPKRTPVSDKEIESVLLGGAYDI